MKDITEKDTRNPIDEEDDFFPFVVPLDGRKIDGKAIGELINYCRRTGKSVSDFTLKEKIKYRITDGSYDHEKYGVKPLSE